MEHRLNVAACFINQGYPINKVLYFVKIHRTTWYRFKKRGVDKRSFNCGRPSPGYSYDKFNNKVYDSKILSAIREIRTKPYLELSGGYKKIKHYLTRQYGYIVNHKKVYRLCRQNNLLISKVKKQKTKRLHSCNRKISKPNQVWEFDIKTGYIHGWNKFFYILVYIDVFSRSIVHYYVGLHCKARNLISTFSTALRKADLDVSHNLVLRSDNGPQMTSKQFYKHLLHLRDIKVEHEFIPCATPNKNAHVESFYSIVESEFIQSHYFKDAKDVYKKFLNFITFYNNERVHSSLKYRTPSEVLTLCKLNKAPTDIKEINI